MHIYKNTEQHTRGNPLKRRVVIAMRTQRVTDAVLTPRCEQHEFKLIDGTFVAHELTNVPVLGQLVRLIACLCVRVYMCMRTRV